jgi:two-component system LytT family sensor kinase
MLPMFHRYKIHHLLFWIAYFFFWIYLYRDFYTDKDLLYKITSVYLVFHAGSYYFIQYVLIPKVLRKTNLIIFGLSILAFAVLLSVIMYFIIFTLMQMPLALFGGESIPVLTMFFLSILFMSGVLIAVKAIIDSRRNQSKSEQIKKEQLESEVRYLKAQMNPHFLFNAINSVYVLINIDQKKASEMLIILSDLLRAQLYEFSEKTISIEQELTYINNYIALEKLRRGDRLSFDLSTSENFTGFRIAPFVLIPFLENCFKHLSNFRDKPNEVVINFTWDSGLFSAHFKNSKDLEMTTERKEGGIGLSNIKRRLDLLYPKRHKLDITDGSEYYEVHLSIKIDESEA